tara:strand:- start:84 stop:377 length:294 start_codon:yes stop_codon:yes gene_type:complete
MARLHVKYYLQEENSVGVEKTKEGGVYLPFSFSSDPQDLSNKVADTMKDIIDKNKNEVLSVYFTAHFEGLKILDGHFYVQETTGDAEWITQSSDTVH